MERICQQLHGKQLPNSLRKIIWKIRLTQAESPTKTKLESENKLVSGDPEEFKQLGFFAHRSALESVIKHAVKEMYNGTPGLGAHVVTAEQEELAISAMNYFCNMSKRAYEPRQILLLYPIICTFGDTDSTAGKFFIVSAAQSVYICSYPSPCGGFFSRIFPQGGRGGDSLHRLRLFRLFSF